MPVRVLVTITAPTQEAAEASLAARVEACRLAEATEAGCLQYEIFRSLTNRSRTVLCELWSTKAIYDKHWNLQLERQKSSPPPVPTPGVAAPVVSVEFYEQQVYVRPDGSWVPADPADRSETVRWMR